MKAGAHSPLYRAVWRWHFYAGLLIMPFLILLAVTGALYLFKPEIEHVVYRDMIEVSERGQPASPSAIETSVEHALRGEMLQVILPERPDRSVRALVRIPSGDVRTAYLDPYDARFLGSTDYGGVMQIVRKIHSLQLFGFWASSLIEIAAGWAIVMVLTGVFLWWPRGADSGVITIRGAPSSRRFWRDLHAVTGAFAGAFMLFLAVTGMPWSMFWGKQVQTWATVQGLGSPPAPAEVTPFFLLGVSQRGGREHDAHSGDIPWAMEQANPPLSHSAQGREIGIDDAVARFEALGLMRPFGVQPPEGPRGAWAATYLPDQVENVRLVYLDQHSGAVIGDVGYADYGAAAKAIEWGIAVHQGQQYGPLNRYLMLAACVAILALAASSLVMWWKRRPKGRLGAPPAPERRNAALGVLGIIALIGAVFPLVGASLLIALCVDWMAQRFLSRGINGKA